MIRRTLQTRLTALARKYPIVTVTGPRQSGKTTLCRATFPRKRYISLENDDTREYARLDPRGFLAELAAGAILDEIQRVPSLLAYLQTEVDARPRAGRFVLTGSANILLLQSVSQSLAGRTALLTLLPLALDEVRRFPESPSALDETLWSGTYPAVFDRRLAASDWYPSYTATYVERDVRQILNVGDLLAFRTFLGLCAGRTGQLLNASALGAEAGVTHATARSWISVLEASYLAWRLPAFHANVAKRLVKAPKLHFFDAGLTCHLLGIRRPEHLRGHPLRGALFESWVAAEIFKACTNRGEVPPLSHFRDRKGGEVDLVLDRGRDVVAIEVKSSQTIASDTFAPLHAFTAQFTRARRGRHVHRVIVYGGQDRQHRSDVTLLPWSDVAAFDWLGERRT